jgi:peptidoglycan/LPS O-acetylase OafA/YrhL
MPTQNERFTKLDGVRGLLSIVVALNHSFLVLAIPNFANVWGQNILQFTNWQSKLQQIFMLLGNGGAAVTLFFIMSGFVMGISMNKMKMDFVEIINFYIKRIVRLYPVYLLILLLTAIYMWTIYTHIVFPMAAPWYSWWMQFKMTLPEFWYNFFFIHAYIGGVTWTLRVILIVSFLFPMFYTINKKTSWWMDILITVFLVYISFNLLNITNFRDLRYCFMFYSGLSLVKFSGFFSKLPSWVIYLTIPLGLFVLTDMRYLTDEYIGGVGEAVASWFLIGVLCYNLNTKIFNFLDTGILKFFGKISYSLYLIHFSVLYVLARFMFQNLVLPFDQYYLLTHSLLFIVSLAIATGISVLVYQFVEKPSADLSRKLQIPEKA